MHGHLPCSVCFQGATRRGPKCPKGPSLPNETRTQPLGQAALCCGELSALQAVELKLGGGRPQSSHGRLPGAGPLKAGKGLQLPPRTRHNDGEPKLCVYVSSRTGTPKGPRETGGYVRRLPLRPAAGGRCTKGGVCLQIKLAAGLRSVARNYKATRLLTRPGQATKSSAKDSSLRAVKLQYASWRPRLPRDHRRQPAKVPGQRPIRIRLRRAGENHPVPAWILT